jgi:hypothetical protein
MQELRNGGRLDALDCPGHPPKLTMMTEDKTTASDPPRAWEKRAVPEESYRAIAETLSSGESPVGIDARLTHVLILHALDRIEQRLGRGPDAAAPASEADATVGRRKEIERQVHILLGRAPAFAKLAAKGREVIERGLVGNLAIVADGSPADVDFPAFVAGLIQGSFESIVDASVQQMEAYAALLRKATESADGFVRAARNERSATQRQQLLATMVLMGVSRFEIGGRGVRARSILDPGEEDDDD